MAYDRFLIAPINNGLQTNLKPFLIPDSAWAELRNMYVFRGRLRKRFGSYLMSSTVLNSRLGINVGTTNAGTGNLSGTVPGQIWQVGQMFMIGTEIYTVYNSATGPKTMLDTGSTTTKTYDVSNGNFVFVGAPKNKPVIFYSGQPVMGLTNYEKGIINDQPSFAYDPQFAYQFLSGSWQQSGAGEVEWNGSVANANSNFFWTANWVGITSDLRSMFVTNFQVTLPTATAWSGLTPGDDPIWYYDGSNWYPFSYSSSTTLNSGNQQPWTVTQTVSGSPRVIQNYVQTCRIIVAFKGRLLLLNTIENNANGADGFDPSNPTTTGITPTNYATSTNTAFPNRCRFSHRGSPLAYNAWLEPNFTYNYNDADTVIADGGGFLDAATDEQIVSAEFIKDRLIVFFERSTWEIAYTGNEVKPFVWQKINTELGSEATFATVPFDKEVLTIGTTGVHACSGANVQRIDDLIPDEIFELKSDNDGLDRIAGIRDYYVEQVYWTFVSSDETSTGVFPNKVLVFNYKSKTWGLNEDCITCFGYYEQQEDITWEETTPQTWQDYNQTWVSGVDQANFREVIAGNQQGFVFIVDADESRNASAMTITNMVQSGPNITLTVINHTLSTDEEGDVESTGDYINIENLQPGTTLTINPTGSGPVNQSIFKVLSITDENTVVVGLDDPQYTVTLTGTYTGGATVARVSNIGLLSKQWNPYLDKGKNVYLAKIDFGIQRTTAGQVTVDYFPSSSEFSMIQNAVQFPTLGTGISTLMGNNVLITYPYPASIVPLESVQDRLWHPVYFQMSGECIQIYIYMTQSQITQIPIANSDFVIEGLVLHTQSSADRLE